MRGFPVLPQWPSANLYNQDHTDTSEKDGESCVMRWQEEENLLTELLVHCVL